MKTRFINSLILTILLFILNPFTTEAAPIDPNGNARLEQEKAAKKQKRKKLFRLKSSADRRAEMADNLYTATFVGAIISVVLPLVLAVVGQSVNLSLEFVILTLFGVSLLAIIFVIIGIIAVVLSVKLSQQPDFEGAPNIYWKALTLGILSTISCLVILLMGIGMETLFFLLIFLITAMIAVSHYFAAWKLRQKSRK